MTGFDWLFTPSRNSWERLFTEPFRTSTPFYRRFILTTVRSPGFKSCPFDSKALSYLIPRKLRIICFRFDCSRDGINLAKQTHSLARYSKRTVEPLEALPDYRC